jgi:hypothetical protein
MPVKPHRLLRNFADVDVDDIAGFEMELRPD